MHELSIATSLINLIVENAQKSGSGNVTKVSIVIGNLAGVVTDSLKFCFDEIKMGTIANDAELVVDEVSATAYCAVCETEFPVGQYVFDCPECGDVIIPSGGKELYLKDMEVE
jgi:hydrogenase nickel incorporation protein HypA/HybF